MLINLDSPMLIMKIDIFNHIYPDEYINAMGSIPDMVKNMANSLRALRDVEYRLSVMDRLGIDQEVLSLAMPAIDGLGLDEKSTKHITVEANNGIRSLVEKYKDRFLGIGTVSLSDPGFAADEAKRCIHDLGLSGIQVVSNVNGKPIDGPELDGFYSVLESIGSGLWIHPTFMANSYPWLKDYNADIALGWDMDTTLALFRAFQVRSARKARQAESGGPSPGLDSAAPCGKDFRFCDAGRNICTNPQEESARRPEKPLCRYSRRDVVAVAKDRIGLFRY
jgi:Predicted metal-dependent hydrolase of the TIM-barrel fold